MRCASDLGEKLPLPKEQTQLDVMVAYLAAEAEKYGCTGTHRLWMPVLPDHIYLDQGNQSTRYPDKGTRYLADAGTWHLETEVGRFDDPENQTVLPFIYSFATGGHLAVFGSVVSGKSTFIQTLLYGLTTRYTPDYLNIYGIDYSSKMLAGFEQSPHMGGIVYEGEPERLAKLFHMLDDILGQRKEILRGGSYIQNRGTRYPEDLPAILLVIDNFAAFNEKTANAYESDVIRLAKEGVSLGIFLVITAGGISMNELPGRIAENMRTAVCLELPDKFAYGDILHTMRIDVLPEKGVRGRGLAWCEDRLLEFQTALALPAEDDYQRMEKIAAEEAALKAAWPGKCARRIPSIPEKPVWEEFAALPEVQALAGNGRFVPVGYEAESAEVYSIDLSKNYCYLVTGNARTGKRNFMKIMIQSCRMKQSEIYIIDMSSDMAVFAGCNDVHMIRTENELFDFFLNTLTPVFQARNKIKKACELTGAEEEELYAATASETPYFIFIPDLPKFITGAYLDERGMSGFLETIVRKGRFHNIYFIGCMPLESRNDLLGYQLFQDFISYHTGIHFGGNAARNTLLSFDYLGYQKQSAVLRPGIGLLPEVMGEHDAEKVIVPLARWKR